jgi:hypothetical protein
MSETGNRPSNTPPRRDGASEGARPEVRKPNPSAPRAGSAPARPELMRRGGQLIIGRLKEHGAAKYQFRANEDTSYYVRLLTSRGERTLWGKDLERALNDAQTQPKRGDLVGARRVRREAVTVTTRQRDTEGRILRQEEHHAHRTRWELEKVQLFAERARLARQIRDEQADARAEVRAHPEIKSAFLSIRAAEEFATQRIANPADRTRFLELVRGAMGASIQKGEPLPSVRLRDRPERERPGPMKSPRGKPEEPTR